MEISQVKSKPHLVFTLSGTYKPRGGMTSSTLLKATNLAREGYGVTLFTLDYRPDQADYVDQMIFNGLVGSGVRIVNFYEELLRDSVLWADRTSEPTESSIVQNENKRLSRYFNSDGSLAYTIFTGENEHEKDSWKRYYNCRRELTKLEEFSTLGTLHRVTLFDERDGKPTQETLVNPKGGAYLIKWLSKQGQVTDAFILTSSPNSTKRYSSIFDAQKQWLEAQIQSLEEEIVIFTDDVTTLRLTEDILLKNKHNILTIHNNQYDHPYTHGSSINEDHKRVLSHAKLWSTIVCSTEQQASDIQRDIDGATKVISIPQAIDPSKDEAQPKRNVRDEKFKIGAFGRLTKQKNYYQLISMFQGIVKRFPNADLDIYGVGSEQGSLEEQINRLGLQQNVRLMGHTNDPRAKMAECDVTVLCSRFEGFGLVIGESMVVGTPVVAFDCNYGPRDIIHDGIDGLLVPNGDFSEMEEALAALIQDRSIVENMRPFAQSKITSRFNRTLITNEWTSLIGQFE